MRPVAIALLALCAACADSTSPADHSQTAELKQLPRPLSSAEQQVGAAGNRFAFSLLNRLANAQRGENVFVSPVSASMALGMLLNGAAGSTATEMRQALSLGAMPLDQVNAGYRDLTALLRSLDPAVDLRVANGVWVDRDLTVYPAFLATAKQAFEADARTVSFLDPATRSGINAWVAQQTGDRIKSIMDDATGDEVMVLANAIYFKGSWRTKFDVGQTHDEPFHAADGVTRTVRMMRAPAGSFLYGATREAQVAELAYGANAWSMVLVLPEQGITASDYAASLTEARWDTLLARLRPAGSTELFVPRFTLQYKRMLNDDLSALGMRSAFVDGGADFTAMSPAGRRLFVTFVTQKTFVEVNEEGTEAAAATGVGVGVTSLPPAMRLDHPFIVAIRERLTGTILFVGVINRLPG